MPEPVTITDLPVHIFENIVKPLGDYGRFILRKVCKSFRDTVDTWDPKYKTVVVEIDLDFVYIKFGDYQLKYSTNPGNRLGVRRFNHVYEADGNFVDVAVDDLYSILSHPQLKLTSFEATKHGRKFSYSKLFETFMDKLAVKLERLDIKIHSESVDSGRSNSQKLMEFLKFFQPGTLKNIKIGRWSEKLFTQVQRKMVDDLNEMEQIKQAESIEIRRGLLKNDGKFTIPRLLKCPDIRLFYGKINGGNAAKVVKNLLNSPILKRAKVFGITKVSTTYMRQLIGAQSDPDRPNILIYPIPGSDEFFEIEFTESRYLTDKTISIERKQKS